MELYFNIMVPSCAVSLNMLLLWSLNCKSDTDFVVYMMYIQQKRNVGREEQFIMATKSIANGIPAPG